MKFKSILFLFALALFAVIVCHAPNLQTILGATVGLSLFLMALNLRGDYRPGFLYANTLTNLIPDVYAALDVVSRELVGFIPSVARNSSSDRVAKNQTLRIFQTRANSAGADSAPAMAIPAAADQTIDNKTIAITKYREFPFSWSGEEQYAMNMGPGYLNIRQDQIAQAIRAAVNEVEAFIFAAIYAGASRAYGTAGTTPFSTNTGEAAQAKKLLDDNGAPLSGRSLIIDTTTGAQLRTLSQLTKVNEAGTAMTLRDGELLNLSTFSIKESAQIVKNAVGTGANYTTTNAGYAVGATTIHLITGTGTILAGDVVTFAGDTNKYVVATGFAGDGTGDIVLAAPGLRKAMSAATKAMTIVQDANNLLAPNVFFTQNAFLLAVRQQICPPEGDLAIARETIVDPRSGLVFELRVYPGKLMNRYEIAIAYGGAVIKPEHCGLLVY